MYLLLVLSIIQWKHIHHCVFVCMCICAHTHTHSLSPPVRFVHSISFTAILLKLATYTLLSTFIHGMHAHKASKQTNKQAYTYTVRTILALFQQIHAHARGIFIRFRVYVCVCERVNATVLSVSDYKHTNMYGSVVCDEALFIRCHFRLFGKPEANQSNSQHNK